MTQRSVWRYTWSKVAAGAAERPTWTDRAGNHLKGVEYGTIIFIGTRLAAVAGFVNEVTLLSILFHTPSHLTGITLKAAISVFIEDPATKT